MRRPLNVHRGGWGVKAKVQTSFRSYRVDTFAAWWYGVCMTEPLSTLLVSARGQRTVTSLAVAAKVSRRSIQHYEAGRIVPPMPILLTLLDAYGVSAKVRNDILTAHMAASRKGVPHV